VAFVDSRGHRIAYDVTGTGPVVVLLAGLSQWRGQWHDAGYVDALASRYRVICVDMLGHGDSDKPHDPARYRLDDIAADVVAVMDADRVERCVVWGFSAGATVALAVASRATERVVGVVCGSGGWQDSADLEQAWRAPLVALLRTPGGLEQFWADVGFTGPQLVADALGRNDPLALAAGLEGSARTRPAYDRIHVPTLGYHGEHEQLPELAELLASLHAEVHVVADAGHLACFDRSHDVLAFVEPFLASLTRSDR
jgi:pimeloyl-ACP methyl ester carboxylesterase